MCIEFSHFSVMLNECIEGLALKQDGLYVDCTAGGGGHSFEIASRLTTGRLIAIDQDADAIAAVRERLAPFSDRVEIVRDNFSNLKTILRGRKADGVLIDLGVSSHQLDTPERGFSYRFDARLDMRMDTSNPVSCHDIVNGYSEASLSDIIYRYGEEKFARKIASAIVKRRQTAPIETTFDLVSIIEQSIPQKFREKGTHPAKRTFQALRIEVNHELDIIPPTVRAIAESLNPGGRMAIITFHSLEDRAVKQTIKSMVDGCTCPSSFPVCVCGFKPTLRQITGKPITPSAEEITENKRSHSAKLRIAEKLPDTETDH